VIRALVKTLGPPCVVIEGEARGADRIAAQEATAAGLTVLRFPAYWTTYGRSAGPIRNQQMLDEGQPEAGFAFYTDKSQSRGARDMASRLFLAGRIVCEYDERLRGWLT